MSDFTYDSEDFSGIRTASTDLKKTEFSALVGAVSAISANLIWNAYQVGGSQPIWRRINVSRIPTFFVIGGLGYALVSSFSRARYAEAAAAVNKKYTSIICNTLDYSN